jgi:NAD(P)-dependent dehydrogenase (short-subunit alcohol dehydrogenase family)
LTVNGAEAARIRVIPADLGDEEQRVRAAGVALEAGPVDILVNNAATVEPLGVTAAIPAAELRRAFELNVLAPVGLTTAVLPGMLDTGWGRIVNVSSGIVDRPGTMVRGNAYRPRGVDTAMQAHIREQDPGRIGTALHTRFNQNFTEGALITPPSAS